MPRDWITSAENYSIYQWPLLPSNTVQPALRPRELKSESETSDSSEEKEDPRDQDYYGEPSRERPGTWSQQDQQSQPWDGECQPVSSQTNRRH